MEVKSNRPPQGDRFGFRSSAIAFGAAMYLLALVDLVVECTCEL